MKKVYIYVFFIVTLLGCKKENSDEIKEEPAAVSVDFQFKSKHNSALLLDISCEVKGEELVAVMPGLENEKSLVLSFNSELTVKINNIIQRSGETINDFSEPIVYNVTFPDGTQKNYKLSVRDFTGIPVFNLTTNAPVVSKDDYVKGSLVIKSNGLYEQSTSPLPLEIKGRGNSTWEMPKKPYRIKLNSAAQILGMPSARNWVLLANYSDKTLLRTNVVFEFGKNLKADFTNTGMSVEVFLNNQYMGSYFLTQQVEVHQNRINISELKPADTNSDIITGGYLLELDMRRDEDVVFETSKKLPFAVKSPDDINTQQLAYIRKYMQDTENAIFAANFADPVNGYQKYIDVNSFINWFLVQEIVKNQDARNYSSMYYHKDRGAKLGMGPLWDFDLSMGNVDYSDAKGPLGWWVRNGVWFNRLFQDPVFKQKVRTRWDEIKKNEIPEMLNSIDRNSKHLDLSQKQNFKKWDILGIYVWPNSQVLGTYSAEVSQIKSWLTKRITWIDENL